MDILVLFRNASLPKKIVAILLSLYFILWAISSPVIKHFAKPIIQSQGLSVAPGASIRYNPFLSQITVSDLTLLKNNKKVAFAHELIIRISLYRLLFDEIAISKFTFNDGYLNISRTAEQLFFAGIDVNKNSEKNSKTESPAPNTDAAPMPYELVLPELTFNDINFDINNEAKHHSIKLQQFIIHKLRASQSAQQAIVSIQSLVDETSFKLDIEANFVNGKGKIKSTLFLSKYPLQKLNPYITELSDLSGLFSFSSEQTITFEGNKAQINIKKANINNEDLVLGYQEQFVNLAHFETELSDIQVSLNNGKITSLSGLSQLSMDNADVYLQQATKKLAHFDNLALKNIKLGFNTQPTVNIDSLMIDGIYASKKEDTDLPALVQLKQFKMTDMLLSQTNIAVDKIIFNQLTSDVIINKDKSLANLIALPTPDSKQENNNKAESVINNTEKTNETNEKSEHELLFSLGELSFINENKISFLDNSVDPIYKRSLFIDTLSIGALSNSSEQKEQKTPFTLKGRSNKYANFNFTGFTQPFASQQIHHLEGNLKELSLPAISTYMKKAMQMELKSGQLNTDLNVTLTGDELDGNITLLVQGLETAVADSEEAGALIDQGALPFNMAIGMLKDSKGNLELDVPISGSTSDPSFGLSSIVTLITQKAIWMATQDYLMTTFIPYANIVSAAMSVGEFALKLRFEDLPYQVKQIEPNDAQQAYLKSFIALMQNKQDTRVSLCAISTPADIDLPSGQKITDKSKIKVLKQLSKQREHALKDYLIKQGKISSSRLLLCTPKIDSSKEAKPRIEISV